MDNKNGIWDRFTAEKYHKSSYKLLISMATLFDREKPVIDFGCGNGYYLSELNKLGYMDTLGFEGTIMPYLAPNVVNRDLTLHIDYNLKGNVISLEVGEHIPKEFQEVYTQNICRHVEKGCHLVTSWAEIG